MQVFYTYVDNFVDRKNKRESYFCASILNSGVLKTPQAPVDAGAIENAGLELYGPSNFGGGGGKCQTGK